MVRRLPRKAGGPKTGGLERAVGGEAAGRSDEDPLERSCPNSMSLREDVQ